MREGDKIQHLLSGKICLKIIYYSNRHNKFPFSVLVGAIYGSFCKAETRFPMSLTIESVLRKISVFAA